MTSTERRFSSGGRVRSGRPTRLENWVRRLIISLRSTLRKIGMSASFFETPWARPRFVKSSRPIIRPPSSTGKRFCFLTNFRPILYYWHRETRGSNAEVDYVIQQGTEIVSIEVKAGTKGQMQSMFLFMDERGIRVSLENFSTFLQPPCLDLSCVNAQSSMVASMPVVEY